MSHPERPPTLSEIRAARERLGDLVLETPVWRWESERLTAALGAAAKVTLKLELLQHAGSFKPRGALAVMLDLDEAARARGVTAVSAGNHAIAVAYAARRLGTNAAVVMPESADPYRVARCRALGARVELVENVHRAFDRAREIADREGRHFVHPFEGPQVALGTATLGLEFLERVPDLEVVIVPIGGGGLCAGVASAVKQIAPGCRVVGVEPTGADTMRRSLEAGRPMAIDEVRTIADSLGAPYALDYSFELCRRHLDDLVLVTDEELRAAMGILFSEVKLAVEPAGAAATAALLGPARDLASGHHTGLIVCGANLSPVRFAELARVPETETSQSRS